MGEIEVRDPGKKRQAPDGAGFSGVCGDFIGDGASHGGSGQAVYAFAGEELDWWVEALGRPIPDGLFGENLTTTGIDVDAAEIGDRWRVGSAVLRVTGPRVPCATFAARMGEEHWVRRFAERGRSGAYLAVVQPGRIAVGDTIHVTASGSGVSVPVTLRAWLGDALAARAVLNAGAHEPEEFDHFAQVAARAT